MLAGQLKPHITMCALTLALQAFRKAIGVRIKEETELIEGEVGPDPLAACAMPDP